MVGRHVCPECGGNLEWNAKAQSLRCPYCGTVVPWSEQTQPELGRAVVEQDLADALKNNEIAAAGLDVLCVEPMSADNPLREIKDSNKLIITPHIAWASVEARTRLMNIILGQVKEYFK